MEHTVIRQLLEKYWQAETSVEEERVLAEYFRQVEIAPDLEPVRGVFAWREEEAARRPGADFDRRILERIGEMERASDSGEWERASGAGELKGEAVRAGGAVRSFSIRLAAAAAIILCVGIGLLIPMISPGPTGATKEVAVIRDTYSDPNQALAAVRHALLTASVRFNEGKNITRKNITRMHDSWQAATGD